MFRIFNLEYHSTLVLSRATSVSRSSVMRRLREWHKRPSDKIAHMENGSKEERDRDSYLRWQKIAVVQLGYAINLFLTLSGAVLAFAVKAMMESGAPLPPCAH